MSQPSPLPRREDEDACYIVVIPAHLLLAEESHHLAIRVGCGVAEYERVVEECAGVEEDGLRFEEEFGEEGEVLGVKLSTNQLELEGTLFGELW